MATLERWHLLCFHPKGNLVDITAFGSEGEAKGHKIQSLKDQRPTPLTDDELHSELLASLMDMDPCDDGDIQYFRPAAIPTAYRYEVEQCTTGDRCTACYEAGFIELACQGGAA